MSDIPRTPAPRCARHNIAMMWYGVDKTRGEYRPKYRCAICVADAKNPSGKGSQQISILGREMTVVDLNGEPIAGDIPDNENLLNLLKRLVAEIESGERVIEDFYLITDRDCGKQIRSFDSGLSAQEGITMLEREKFHILCALEGVKV